MLDREQVGALIRGATGIGLKAFDMETTVTASAERGTLIPFQYTFDRNTSMELDAGATGGEKSRRTYTYAYD